MEIPSDISQFLYSILESYICATGYDYPDYFKENKIAKDAYNLLKPKEGEHMSGEKTVGRAGIATYDQLKKIGKEKEIEESTPKSAIEKIHRKTRKFSRVKKHNGPQMLGRVTPKKTGNPDPTRGGNRITEDFEESIFFLRDNVKKTGKSLDEALDKLVHGSTLYEMLNSMIAVGMGGWMVCENGFINESGRIINEDNWVLKGDRLVSKNGNQPNFDIGWLIDLRQRMRDRIDH